MKVALCISGQPRSVQETFPYIYENIIKINNPDVYIHTWINDEIRGMRPVAACGEVASNPIPHNIEEVIVNLYKPKRFQPDEPIEFDEKNYNDRRAMFIRPKNSISQRFSVWQSIGMVPVNNQYDAIIRMRFDWAIETPIDVSTLPLDHITTPNDCPHPGGFNDQFAVGSVYNMNQYAKLFFELDNLYNKQGVPFVDEVLLGQHLKNCNIPINAIPIKYRLVRSNINPHERHGADYVK